MNKLDGLEKAGKSIVTAQRGMCEDGAERRCVCESVGKGHSSQAEDVGVEKEGDI